jgi:hypothetical protein
MCHRKWRSISEHVNETWLFHWSSWPPLIYTQYKNTTKLMFLTSKMKYIGNSVKKNQIQHEMILVTRHEHFSCEVFIVYSQNYSWSTYFNADILSKLLLHHPTVICHHAHVSYFLISSFHLRSPCSSLNAPRFAGK